jgi:hypothetical protein
MLASNAKKMRRSNIHAARPAALRVSASLNPAVGLNKK